MTDMPDHAVNLPNPTADSSAPVPGRVLSWPVGKGHAVVSPLLAEVSTYLDSLGGGEGLFPTPLGDVHIVRSFQERMPVRQIYKPSLCIVLSGAKEILFGSSRLQYEALECLVVSVEKPASGRVIRASADFPYIGITIDLDVSMLRDVLEQVEIDVAPDLDPGGSVFVAKIDGSLADCIMRLMKMLHTPKAIPVLYPALMRELCYWLLSGPHGGTLVHLALPESNVVRIRKAIHFLRESFVQPLRVEQMAEVAGMSASSFHQHFKALTSVTPLQFQKQLRLTEARRLLVAEASSVEQAAYQVGYESSSQFSREYSRMFGLAPKQDALQHQRMYKQYASRKAGQP
jgi:AraC-like DNA-binding protein